MSIRYYQVSDLFCCSTFLDRVEGTGTLLTASLCNDDTDYDTAISVFTGDCVDLECVAGNNDSDRSECGLKSELTWLTKPGRTYYLLIHGYDTRVGNFGLVMNEPEPAVSNDYCVDALPLLPSSNVITGSTIDATMDDTLPCSDIEQNGPGVFYTVVGTGERLVASTCNTNENQGTSLDTKISVFTGSCGNLTCTLADDDYCDLQSRLVWLSEANTTYYIMVHGEDSVGDFHLVVDNFVPESTNDFCSSAQGPLLPNGDTVTGSTVDSSFDDVGFCG